MKHLVSRTSINPDSFFPCCFDLTDPDDFDAFKEKFMLIKAESIVKKFYHEIETIDEKVVKTALDICERRLLSLDEIIDIKDFPESLVEDFEWDIIGKDELDEKSLQKKKHTDWLKKMDCKTTRLYIDPAKKKEEEKKRKKRSKKVSEKNDERLANEEDDEYEEDIKERSERVLMRLKEIDPQYDLNGYNNIWIVKPAGLSRGRGIEVYNTLVEIIDNCYREGHWVAMKYIENPMIIANRKFDIR